MNKYISLVSIEFLLWVNTEFLAYKVCILSLKCTLQMQSSFELEILLLRYNIISRLKNYISIKEKDEKYYYMPRERDMIYRLILN